MKKKILLALLLGALLAVGIGIYLYTKPAETAVSGTADFVVPAEELYAAFEADEASANEKYLNKVVEVQGIVQSVSEANTGLNITLEGGEGAMFGVSCHVPEPGRRAAAIREGDPLVVKGLCTGKLMDVVLVKGTIH